MDELKYTRQRPHRIITESHADIEFHHEVKSVFVDGLLPVTTVVEHGYSYGATSISAKGTATVQIVPSEGYSLPANIVVDGVSYFHYGEDGTVELHDPFAEVTIYAKCDEIFNASPLLENNPWELIRRVCEAGKATAYWSVGDEKNVIGGDGYSRSVMIVDMQGLYGKHVVFHFRETTFKEYKLGSYSQYATSDMNVDYLKHEIANDVLSNELKSSLTNTTFKSAFGYNGDWAESDAHKNETLSVTSKLFLPAEKELTTQSNSTSNMAEFNALTTFQYYEDNDKDKRILYTPWAIEDGVEHHDKAIWRTRSPIKDVVPINIAVNINGNLLLQPPVRLTKVAPCFAF